MIVRIEPSWLQVLQNEFEKPYFSNLAEFVKSEYKSNIVYPVASHIFEAFSRTPYSAVRVVILGQDPYHGPGQAHGLSFSVQDGVPIPPSLINIYKEIESDLGIQTSRSGDLTKWAHQGVLLLNSTLTVRNGAPGSHQHKGWEEFTDAVIQVLNDTKEHIVFLLWGAYAQKKGAHIDRTRHLVLEAPHPSPLSAYNGFFGSRPFSQTNAYLIMHDQEPIDW